MPGNIGDFKELIENSKELGLFVDKSLFIQEIIKSKRDPILITRPRRWGKTINLSMLFYFFVDRKQLLEMGKSVEFINQCDDLFKELKIFTNNADRNLAKNYMRQYPVIFISFAGSIDDSSKDDIVKPDWSKIKGLIISKIAEVFSEFDYVAANLKKIIDEKFNLKLEQKIAEYKNQFQLITLSEIERVKIYEQIKVDQLLYPEQQQLEKFNRIRNKEFQDDAELSESINFLAKLLNKLHKKPVYILVDEYDSIINKYFNATEILKKLTATFSGIFSAFAKPTGMINDHIEKVIFTGILRVAKANIFSSLNNLGEYTILDQRFSEHYGFTTQEVASLLEKANITINAQSIKNWYNGYTVGQHIMYNPWSIMCCIDNGGSLEPYWAETADPAIIQELLVERSSQEYKLKIRDLIKHNQAQLQFELEKRVSFEDLNNNPEILWSVLVHTGYLTLAQVDDRVHVRLPNEEIRKVLKKYIDNWFSAHPTFTKAANSLLVGDLLNFKEAVTKMLKNPAYSARIFSGGGKASNVESSLDLKEFIYQFLIMTELRCINIDPRNQDYEVMCEPNNVSFRKTRPDFLVINHKLKLCVVGELKISDKKQQNLDELALKEAIAQINNNQYGKKYQDMGYQLIKLGLAFKGGNFGIAYELP